MNKKFIISIGTIVILALFIFGCSSMELVKYERIMKNILSDVMEEMKGLEEEALENEMIEKDKVEDMNRKIIEILKNANLKIKKVIPPKEFFSGHSDLIEFLEIYTVSGEKILDLASKPTTEAVSLEERQELINDLRASLVSYQRANSELPFLSYEMQKAFSPVITGLSRFQEQLIQSERQLPAPVKVEETKSVETTDVEGNDSSDEKERSDK